MDTLKIALSIALAVLLLTSLYAVSSVQATDVIGRLTSDTTWTKAQSPITLTGPVNVDNGVTLVIEQGVTVNLDGYYIQVEGTLRSIGTNTEQVTFNNGKINFKENNNYWNPQTNTGNIIENSKLIGVTINAYPAPAIKFHQNSLSGDLTVAGTSTVTDNTIIGTITVDGSAIVWKNNVQGSITCSGYEATEQKYPIISCNTVSGRTGAGIGCSGYAQVEDNTISNCKYGISISIGYVAGYIFAPHVTALRNEVSNCEQGLHLEIYTSTIYTSGYESVASNTFSHCKEGVHASGELYGLILKNNNIIDCSSYRFYLEGGGEVNATLNWWGTTDTAAIKQSIYDSSRDFNLGTVTFEPLLTAENTEAYPNQNAEMPTMQSTTSPTPNVTSQPTPAQTDEPSASDATAIPTILPTHHSNENLIVGSFDLELGIFATLVIVIVLLAVLIVVVLKRSKSKTTE